MWLLVTAGRVFSRRILEANPYIAFDHERRGVVAHANALYQTFPDEPCYGFICDDMVPRTAYWYEALEAAAGDRRIAICNDLAVPEFYSNPFRCGSCFVLGGELVRAAGWFLPPWCVQRGVDTVWNRVARAFDLFEYLPEVEVECLYASNGGGKRPFDDIDKVSLSASHSDPVKTPEARAHEAALHERIAHVVAGHHGGA